MSTSKHIDKICIAAVCLMLVLTILFMCGGILGISSAVRTVKYENTLFDTSYVHRIDIVMDDWDSFIENCENEEYSSCTAVIDGDQYKNIAIRAKGNTSLSSVRSLGSQRYSFKLEFDHYEDGKSCDGLDKLCLNNLIQDNTMMKDYIVYQMMNDFGVDSPLCSFAYITVNGEDWGLYLALEGVEDSFLSRNYGSDAGELYKPDSMSFGGGRGNGKGFDMDEFKEKFESSEAEQPLQPDITADNAATKSTAFQPLAESDRQGGMTSPPDEREGGMNGLPPDEREGGMNGLPPDFSGEGMPQIPDGQQSKMPRMSGGEAMPGGFPQMPGDNSQQGENDFSSDGDRQSQNSRMPGDSGRGMGSDDVKLKYIDDDPDSYSNIFNNAKTNISAKDKNRLISSLKNLSEYSDLEDVLDMDEVLRYFVVHNFVCNGDSYTGSMIHNYYLHEKDGKLGMIPWDYNLAFGTFQGGDASGTINTSVDSPVSGGNADDRPMVGWIFSDEEYTGMYHELFAEFIERWFTDGELTSMIDTAAEMIRPYVENDPTKFCTTDEFGNAVDALLKFVDLRAKAVTRQLNGDNTKVDTDGLILSDMGTMGKGMGGGFDKGQNGGLGLSSMLTVTDKNGNKVDLSEIIGDISDISAVTLSDGTTVEISSSDPSSLSQIDLSDIVAATDNKGNVIDLSEYSISFSLPGSNNRSFDSGDNRENPGESIDDPEKSVREQFEADTGRNENNMFPGGSAKNVNNTSDEMIYILLAASFAVLIIGLLIAIKKKY